MTADLTARLRDGIGSTGLVSDPDGYLTDWRNACSGTAAAVVRPGTTEELAQNRHSPVSAAGYMFSPRMLPLFR
ncbi:hypothetical protein [Haloactinomyces albus]|uniref:Uncharacterized protein n=1 Tax=Haloactinomyces albus TaxID=1352928 RepID=A0AAE3ZGY5_9ACTN|nr:hypothetical protein [Haloactinomyces albus]MDR7303706.1 hypothetical protein [Haloactinomyces albus]